MLIDKINSHSQDPEPEKELANSLAMDDGVVLVPVLKCDCAKVCKVWRVTTADSNIPQHLHDVALAGWRQDVL